MRARSVKFHKLYKTLFQRAMRGLKHGTLVVQDGTSTERYGQNDPTSTLTILAPNAYQRMVINGSMGAAQSYIKGEWSTDDLYKLFMLSLKNKKVFSHIDNPLAHAVGSFRNLALALTPNTIKRAKERIIAHYDLGNDFFKLILDPSMMYSCAIFDTPETTLEQASLRKLARICENLQLKATDHVLEIGSGWGGFAFYAAEHYGCKVTTTTISDQQYDYVRSEIARRHLGEKIELLAMDYRKLNGNYDKLVSIEMIESIGYKQFDTYFKQCNDLLKPGGLFCLQAILINDHDYERSKHEIDFMKQYIFPGGCLPSLNAITDSVARQTNLELIDLHDIGLHYVTTLKHWMDNLHKNIELIKAQGFDDEFIRTFEYYFCYCMAGFSTRHINNVQALWLKREI